MLVGTHASNGEDWRWRGCTIIGQLTWSNKRANFDGLITYFPCCVMLILPMKRFKSAYAMKHFKNCIRIVSKSVKRILEKYWNRQKRFIKEFIFSKVVGWRLAVLLIMISFSFIFQGIWFKVACVVNIKLFFYGLILLWLDNTNLVMENPIKKFG